jgi:hypothetical protein
MGSWDSRVHRAAFTALECFGLCGFFLFLGLFAGYAYAMRHLEKMVMKHLAEKERWIRSLRDSAQRPERP